MAKLATKMTKSRGVATVSDKAKNGFELVVSLDFIRHLWVLLAFLSLDLTRWGDVKGYVLFSSKFDMFFALLLYFLTVTLSVSPKKTTARTHAMLAIFAVISVKNFIGNISDYILPIIAASFIVAFNQHTHKLIPPLSVLLVSILDPQRAISRLHAIKKDVGQGLFRYWLSFVLIFSGWILYMIYLPKNVKNFVIVGLMSLLAVIVAYLFEHKKEHEFAIRLFSGIGFILIIFDFTFAQGILTFLAEKLKMQYHEIRLITQLLSVFLIINSQVLVAFLSMFIDFKAKAKKELENE